MGHYPASPAVQDATRETHFPPEAQGVLKQELHDLGAGGGREETGKEAGKNIREHWRDTVAADMF